MSQDITRYNHPFWSSDGNDLSEFIALIDSGKFNAPEHFLLAVVSRGKMKLFQLLTTRVFDLKNLRDIGTRDMLLTRAICADDLVFVEYLLDHLWTLSELDAKTVKPIVYSLENILSDNRKNMKKMITLFLNRGWDPTWRSADIKFAAAHRPLDICQLIFEATDPQKLTLEVFYHLLYFSSDENLRWIRDHWEIPKNLPWFFTRACHKPNLLRALLSKKDARSAGAGYIPTILTF